jgi:Skp family chaperone for outer membrane proteins
MHTTIRTTVAAVALALLGGLAVPVRAQAIKIGVFDPARVSEEVADAQQLQANLVAMRETKQAAIAAKEQTLIEMRQKLQQQALSLSPDKRTTMEIEIQRKVIEVNSLKETANQELQLEFAAAEARFNDKLRAVVEQYGRDQGFALILDATTVAWASMAIDLTVPIIDQYNRQFPATPAVGTAPGSSN